MNPVLAFVSIALGLGWVLLSIPAVTGLPPEPFLLVTCYAGLMGTALVLTRRSHGSVRDLLRDVLRWRFGIGRWLVILFAMPLLTAGVAALTGTLVRPSVPLWLVALSYLAQVLLLGALLFNIPEEIGWSGFVQTRLMHRYGLLGGSLRTAALFVGIHLPLLFGAGWTWRSVGVSAAALIAAAPFFRYLLGMHLLDTRYSLLAVGIQHAAFNASGALAFVHGGWQYLPAMAVLTLAMALVRSRRRAPAAVPVPVPAPAAVEV
jgi:membrane protease YdiL (CAAX protease family)